MTRKKRKGKETDETTPAADAQGGPLQVSGEWMDRVRPTWRTFPGPKRAGVALRVAMERQPYADLLAHAKEALDVEVCGVLVGDVCEDEEGLFVHVQATIRGEAAKAGSAHVTYTQETWTAIHREMEARYPKRSIVGWYHTHPGFGATFSDMDTFIQNNFFAGPTQIAYLLDPLGGAEALGVNEGGRLTYVPRFWVDGRERPAHTPVQRGAPATDADARVPPSSDQLRQLEARVAQLVQAVEDQRVFVERGLLTLGIVIAAAVVGWIGYGVWTHTTADREPPQLVQYIPFPVRVGDQDVLLGIGLYGWRVPPEVRSAYVELERQRREAEERQKGEGAEGAAQDSAAAPSKREQDPDQ